MREFDVRKVELKAKYKEISQKQWNKSSKRFMYNYGFKLTLTLTNISLEPHIYQLRFNSKFFYHRPIHRTSTTNQPFYLTITPNLSKVMAVSCCLRGERLFSDQKRYLWIGYNDKLPIIWESTQEGSWLNFKLIGENMSNFVILRNLYLLLANITCRKKLKKQKKTRYLIGIEDKMRNRPVIKMKQLLRLPGESMCCYYGFYSISLETTSRGFETIWERTSRLSQQNPKQLIIIS